MTLSWLALFIAGIFEIGWPLGLKKSHTDSGLQWEWIVLAAVSMIASGVFLFYAQKTIPMGTAYAVWTGIGAAGTFMVGVYLFNDALSLMRMFGVLMIIGGVVCLKLG